MNESSSTVLPSDILGIQRKNYSNRRELESALEDTIRSLLEEKEAAVAEAADAAKDGDWTETVQQEVEDLKESIWTIMSENDECMSIGQIEAAAGVSRKILHAILEDLIDEDRAGKESAGRGTLYWNIE
jgi:hypothetical protein